MQCGDNNKMITLVVKSTVNTGTRPPVDKAEY